MKTDTLGRRVRNKRQPLKEVNHPFTERDLAWLLFLLRNGNLLSIDYLHKFTADTHKNLTKSNDRQNVLFNELALFSRPKQQFDVNNNFYYRKLIHSASDRAIEMIEKMGQGSEYFPSPVGSFPHQLLVSCVLASFELSCKGTSWTYTPQHEVLEHAGRGLKLDIEGEDLTPDGVFMLTKEGKKLLVFLEVDRGTVPTWSDTRRKSHSSEIKKYRKLIGQKLYKDLFRVECGAIVMILTSSQAKQTGILDDVVKRIYGTPCSYIFTHFVPGFGSQYFLPDPMDMFDIEWKLSGHEPFTFGK